MMSGALSRPVRSMADNRVQKTIVSLLALKKRKRLSQFRDETRSSLAPLLHALMRRQRPAASYSGLSKLSSDVSKYRPEAYKSEKLKNPKKIHRVALVELLLEIYFLFRFDDYY